MFKKILMAFGLLYCYSFSWSADQIWCIYDPVGTQGDITRRAKEIGNYALSQHIKIQIKSYQSEKEAILRFDQKQCSGLIASNFNTRKYNRFMASTSGVGFISSNQTAKSFMQLLGNADLTPYMYQNDYEAVGMLPLGMAYMVLTGTDINTVSDLKNKKIGVLKDDMPQIALVKAVGAQPVTIEFESAIKAFKENRIDILPAPIYGLLPYKLENEFGKPIRVVNFPLAYTAMNVIIRQNNYPKRFGQYIRNWFSLHSASLINQAIRWENSLSAYYWMDVSYQEKQAYDMMLARVRQRFIQSEYYDPHFVKLIRRLRCMDEPRYFECQFRS
ncbi:putative solute-binding protein [Acinetobacter sp.]|uniref:putative solute-binding protein n=1 Tax=Acinetobacter sp. TaxID=472 RepID=UPI000C08F3CA|nr:putative solute-binding protein [Acinetobacter sp.]MAK31715.1 RND transporter [Acinetobacter sp.]